MVDHSSLANIAATLDRGNSTLAKLRSAADEGSPLAKVVDLIADLSQRLDKVEASNAEAARTAPMHLRKG